MVAGLTLSLMLGPAFFTLLQTSLEKGFRHAVRLAFGVFLSDAFLVTISILGASRLFNDPAASRIIGIVGGLSLVLIGIYTFRKKVVIQGMADRQAEMQLPSHWRGFFPLYGGKRALSTPARKRACPTLGIWEKKACGRGSMRWFHRGPRTKGAPEFGS